MGDQISREVTDDIGRDPFRKALQLNASDRLIALTVPLLPPALQARHAAGDMPIVLYLMPASKPKNVIDAKPDGKCDRCGCICWMEPSTLKRAYDYSLCQTCTGPEIDDAIYEMLSEALGRHR